MFRRNIGQNLSAVLVRQLRKEGIDVKVIDQRFARPIHIKINNVLIYVKYANLNKAGNWYFGFYPDDIIDDTLCSYAIFLCGEVNIVRTYLLPFDRVSSFARTGSLVSSSTRSEQYQSHIFPDRGFIMKMIGNADSELHMAQFQLHHGEIDSNLIGRLLHKVRCR